MGVYIHLFALTGSNLAKSLINPVDLHAMIAMMQTIDYHLLALATPAQQLVHSHT